MAVPHHHWIRLTFIIAAMDLNIGTLNVRVISKEYAKQALAEDIEKYKLGILSIQEIKINEAKRLFAKTHEKSWYLYRMVAQIRYARGK